MRVSYFFDILNSGKNRLSEESLGMIAAFLIKEEKIGPLYLGMHEGTMLSGEAYTQGLETESFTVDAGLAPRERDWVAQKMKKIPRLFFQAKKAAELSRKLLEKNFSLKIGKVRTQKNEDWNKNWSKRFKGIVLKDLLVIPYSDGNVSPSVQKSFLKKQRLIGEAKNRRKVPKKILKINPGAGFGTGTHETTQLCLEFLTHDAQHFFGKKKTNLKKGVKALDFGSGSGILSIGLCLFGAQKVDAVEIDDLAIENAKGNAKLNQVERKIRFSKKVPTHGRYDLVVANILRPILLASVDLLTSSLRPRSVLVLSGLVENDVEPVIRAFEMKLKKQYGKTSISPPIVRRRREWRAIRWVVNANDAVS